jgi:hypothetical protein
MAMDAEAVDFLATMQRHACGPATAVGFIKLLNEYDVRDVLPTLRLPVLVVAPKGLPNDWLSLGRSNSPTHRGGRLPPTASRGAEALAPVRDPRDESVPGHRASAA